MKFKKTIYFLLLIALGIGFASAIQAQDTVKAKKGDSIKIEIVCGECDDCKAGKNCLVANRWDHDEFIKEMQWRLEAIHLRVKEMEFFLDPKIPSKTKPSIPPQPTRILPATVSTAMPKDITASDDDMVRVTGDGDRVTLVAKLLAKTILKAKLQVEKLKLPRRRDEALIKKLEFAIEADELIELELQSVVDEYKSKRVNVQELGDGELFRDLLDFLGDSEKFGAFIDNLVKLIDKIFELIGGLAINVDRDSIQELLILKHVLRNLKAMV